MAISHIRVTASLMFSASVPSPSAIATPPTVFAPPLADAPALVVRKPKRHQHIPALDGVRGLAILLVLVFHFGQLSYYQLPTAVQRVLGAGWVGVDLFFVLSGFLITSILCEAKGTAGYFKTFYMRRVLRIFPLYYGVLAIAGLFGLIYFDRLPRGYQTVAQYQVALWAYLQNFISIDWMGFTHFWSLGVEEHFYLVWPALVFFLSRRHASIACIVLIVTAVAIRTARVLSHADVEATYNWTICRMDALALGSLLALMAHGTVLGVYRYRQAAKWTLGASLAVIAGMFVYHGSLSHIHPSIQAVGYTFVGLASVSFLVLTISAGKKGLLGIIFNATWLRFLGKYSYGVYVFHGFVVVSMREVLPSWKISRAAGGSALAALAVHLVLGALISIGIALLSWHLYEKHFLKLKKFFEYRAATMEGFKANEPVGSSASAKADSISSAL